MKNRKIVGINRKSKNRGRVGMLNKIHRLRSVGMDNGIATGFGILYVAEEAYPLIPYVRGNEHPLAFGRTPRLLSILFTTFVNTQNADYNGKTRTLTIGKDVRQVARRMGMLTGGCGRQNTVTSIIGYQDITFTSRDGKEIKPIEETNIVQGESWNEKTITFTWEYVRLMSREPKEIPPSSEPVAEACPWICWCSRRSTVRSRRNCISVEIIYTRSSPVRARRRCPPSTSPSASQSSTRFRKSGYSR